MQPEAKGTIITEMPNGNGAKAIAAKDGIIAIKIKSSRMLLAYGFLRKIFEIFEKYRTPIDMITTSEVAVSITIDSQQYLDQILKELQPFGTVELDFHQTIVSIVGNEVAATPSIITKLFDAMEEIPLRMISYGGSRHNISILINGQYKVKTLQVLNKGLFGLE
jgi:aspartate kinase